VVNCSTSGMTAMVAAQRGVACHVSAVGEANVVDQMLATGAVIGGEGNGGVIDPRVVLVRDSIAGMALVLERMCAGGSLTSLETLAQRLPQRVMLKTKVQLGPADRGAGLTAAFDRIAAAFPQAEASRLDGLRLAEDGMWVLVRASNTEPIVRIVAEAETASGAEAAIERARAAMTSPAG
jgi:phosphomannomutase